MIILNYLFFKPILKVADDRAKKMAELKQGARQAAKSGEKALAEYEKRLADMRRESSETVAEARKEAVEASSQIVEKAQKEFSSQAFSFPRRACATGGRGFQKP